MPNNYQKQYRENNKEKIAEQHKQYYENNKEKIAEQKKQYLENNKEKIVEYKKQYNENNKEKIAEQRKQYRENNKEKKQEYMKQYYEENKEKILLRLNRINNIEKYSDISEAWLTRKICRLKNGEYACTLTTDELLELIPKDLKCPIFKTKFVFKGNDKSMFLSVDRIDNNSGYHKDNVTIVSLRANAMKSSATLKELYQVADFYYELDKKQLDK